MIRFSNVVSNWKFEYFEGGGGGEGGGGRLLGTWEYIFKVKIGIFEFSDTFQLEFLKMKVLFYKHLHKCLHLAPIGISYHQNYIIRACELIF